MRQSIFHSVIESCLHLNNRQTTLRYAVAFDRSDITNCLTVVNWALHPTLISMLAAIIQHMIDFPHCRVFPNLSSSHMTLRKDLMIKFPTSIKTGTHFGFLNVCVMLLFV